MAKPKKKSGPPRRLSRVEERQAALVAEELLVCGVGASLVKMEVGKAFAVGVTKATSIVKAAEESLLAPLDSDTDKRRTQLERMCMLVFKKCIQGGGTLNAANGAVGQLSRMWGLDAPHRIVATTHSTPHNDMDNRSDAELDYFIEYHCWPEEDGANGAHILTEHVPTDKDPLSELH